MTDRDSLMIHTRRMAIRIATATVLVIAAGSCTNDASSDESDSEVAAALGLPEDAEFCDVLHAASIDLGDAESDPQYAYADSGDLDYWVATWNRQVEYFTLMEPLVDPALLPGLEQALETLRTLRDHPSPNSEHSDLILYEARLQVGLFWAECPR